MDTMIVIVNWFSISEYESSCKSIFKDIHGESRDYFRVKRFNSPWLLLVRSKRVSTFSVMASGLPLP